MVSDKIEPLGRGTTEVHKRKIMYTIDGIFILITESKLESVCV